MTCPLLAKVSQLTGDGQYLAEAVRQLQLFARRLQDPQTGLYYHVWDETTGKPTAEFWARGNGWAILSMIETLECLPKQGEAYKNLRRLFLAQLDELIKFQDGSGGWHTVVNRPDAYLESSASAIIVYTIEKAVRFGIVAEKYRPHAETGWRFLMTKVTPEGQLIGVSVGTPPGDFMHYQTRAVGTFTWGTGVFLLAAGERMMPGTKQPAPSVK